MPTNSTTQNPIPTRETTSQTTGTPRPRPDSGEGASAMSGFDPTTPRSGIADELRQLVRDKATEQIGTQKERAAGTLGAVVGAVRSATEGLRENGQTGLAGYVTRGADEIDRWTSKLRDQDVAETVRELQDFARRKPAIFLGVAFGAGVLAARFFKSSGPGGSSTGRAPTAWTPAPAYAERPSVAHDTPTVGPIHSPRGEGL